MGKSNLPLLGFNAIERDSMSTHVHGFSFLPAKTVSFDQTKANNRCRYNLSVLQRKVLRSCTTTFPEMAVYTFSCAAAYLCHKQAGEREKKARSHFFGGELVRGSAEYRGDINDYSAFERFKNELQVQHDLCVTINKATNIEPRARKNK